jgi:alpha-glucosidase
MSSPLTGSTSAPDDGAMLRCIFAVVFSLAFATQAGTIDLTSPDGTVRCQISTNAEAHLLYSVTQDRQTRLEPAEAGVIINDVDLGAKVTLGKPRTRSISEVFPWRGNKTTATNLCRASEIPIRSQAGVDWTLQVRVFNDGVGFRYRLPGNGARSVQGESTRWQLPKDSTVWFQTDTVNYEGAYQSARADQMPLEKEVKKEMRPTFLGLPMTAVFQDGTFGMVSEAALRHYSGLTLRPEGGAKFRAAFEDDPNGWSEVGPVLSPWRVIVLGKDLNALVNSDVIAALCEPPDPKLFPDGFDTPWIRPGKAPCTWMVFGNDGAQWDRQKWFVDVSAATGCEYLLVDGGWQSEKWGWLKGGGDLWERAAELCRYAAERNVGILLWHGFPEGRDDGPGLTTVEAREKLFQNCQKAGVKGVKIDFFDSESRAVIEAYEDLLRRAANHQIMVNFHGANKPTGEPRTWPNEMTREGIREQEYVLWGPLPLAHYGALPFTRMAAGHGDFLPGYLQPRFLRNTTRIFQMASVIVFSTPFLCWPDNPEAYLNSPLLQFVRNVPVTWDETRVLPGSAIGDTVIMARRKGVEWYVAVLNCRSEPRSLDLDLSPFGLAGKELTLYRDGSDNTACVIETGLKPPGDAKLSVALKPGGGFMAHLCPPKEFSGWK